jgi:predicted transcriptional regulator of viral defense system
MKNPQTVERSIIRRFQKSPRGSVFAAKQLLDIGDRSAVSVALHRLVQAGKIRRIRRGLYDLPQKHPITRLTAPNILGTVRALMRGSQAQWQFSGAYAANALGLSEQVPSKIVILTDGGPRKVALGKLTLVFRRAAPRNLIGAGKKAGLVIQALRHLKSSAELSRHVTTLARTLDPRTKASLKKLQSLTAAWMQPLLETITEG